MSDPISARLATRDWLLADGAMGTNLFALGLEHGDSPELWNLEHPERIKRHHRSFVDAGSDLILTNTFGGTANRLKLHKAEARVLEINAAAARLAREVVAESGRDVIVAGSMGPTGELFEPLGPLSLEDGKAAFLAQASALAEGGADILWIETMSSEDEVRAAAAAAAETGLPYTVTMSFDTNGRTMMGVTPARVAEIAHELKPTPVAFGGNCGTGASELMVAVLNMRTALGPDDVMIAKSNCGIPEYVEGEIRYSGTPELMADYACLARDLGIRVIGGCCGTTPEHVRAMREALESRPMNGLPDVERIVACLGEASKGALGQADPDSAGTPPASARRSRRRARTE